jgi:transcription elongation GreA/GreB family factor
MFLEQQPTRTDALPVTTGPRQYGIGSNNDEHMAIREDELIIDARIAGLEDILRRAHVVAPSEAEDTIAIGSAITVMDCRSGAAAEHLIQSPHCVTAANGVSAASRLEVLAVRVAS